MVGQQHVVDVGGHSATWPRRIARAVVRARQRHICVREHEELEVVVAQRQLLEALQRLRQRRRRIQAAQRERRYAAQRHLDDRPQRAQPHPRRAEHLGVALGRAHERRAVREHQRQLGHLRGDVAKARARSVCRRRDRSGDRLHVDVAEVLHRQPVCIEPPAQLADRDSRLHTHEPARRIDVEYARQAVQRHDHAVAACDVAERVARAGRAHAQPAGLARSIAAASSSWEPRALDRCGPAALISRPVAPARGRAPVGSLGSLIR